MINEMKGKRISITWVDNDITTRQLKSNTGGSHVSEMLSMFVGRLNRLRSSQGKKEVKNIKNLKQILNGYKAYGKVKYFNIK